MKKQMAVLVMFFALTLVPGCLYAKELGPAYTYSELLQLIEEAGSGDTVLVSGMIQADETVPLITTEDVAICSAPNQKAVISGMHILDSNLSFSDVELIDSLDIHGSSKVMLAENVKVSGGKDAAIRFKGDGELIITPSCSITATDGANGIRIEHEGGSFYAALEGTVVGGSADIGGAGVIVSPLNKEGVLLIGGDISGGKGTDIGGNAVNLYDIGGNAYISVIGSIQGGIGPVGGNGLQIISPRDTSNIGIIGQVKGGEGDAFGGNAVVVLNAEDRSSIALSGALIGGNSSSESSDPGQSLLLVGNGALNHMYSNGCLLEDGQVIANVNPIPTTDPSAGLPENGSTADNGTQSGGTETIDVNGIYEEANRIEPSAEMAQSAPVPANGTSEASGKATSPILTETESKPAEAETKPVQQIAVESPSLKQNETTESGKTTPETAGTAEGASTEQRASEPAAETDTDGSKQSTVTGDESALAENSTETPAKDFPTEQTDQAPAENPAEGNAAADNEQTPSNNETPSSSNKEQTIPTDEAVSPAPADAVQIVPANEESPSAPTDSEQTVPVNEAAASVPAGSEQTVPANDAASSAPAGDEQTVPANEAEVSAPAGNEQTMPVNGSASSASTEKKQTVPANEAASSAPVNQEQTVPANVQMVQTNEEGLPSVHSEEEQKSQEDEPSSPSSGAETDVTDENSTENLTDEEGNPLSSKTLLHDSGKEKTKPSHNEKENSSTQKETHPVTEDTAHHKSTKKSAVPTGAVKTAF